MTQLDIYSLMNGEIRDPKRAVNVTQAIAYAKAGVGSILNCPFPGPLGDRIGWTAADWREVLGQLKEIYREHSRVPFIYGIDSTHGATYVIGATLFGQPLSAASTFNSELLWKMGEIQARDTLAAGIPWVFSPVLGIAVQPLWSRVYETFGEDPYAVSVLGASFIRGIQSSGKVAACMKHYIGYSNPTSGLDRSDSVISDWDLLNYYSLPFRSAVAAGVKTAMETYVSINGDPVIASHKLLQSLLRDDMGFHGMLVSDYSEVDRLIFEHQLVAQMEDAVWVALNRTSLDMNMGPNLRKFQDGVDNLVKSRRLSEDRINESVRRILRLKKELNLLRHGSEATRTIELPTNKSNDLHVALKVAEESIILVENRNQTLPIQLHDVKPQDKSVFITGPIGHSIGYMCGGWSIYWQGSSNSSHFAHGKSIYDAMQDTLDSSWTITHDEVVNIQGDTTPARFANGLHLARRHKYTVVVIGERNYAEKHGDIQDLTLPAGQLEYVRALTTIPTTKVIVVIISGRPRLLGNSISRAHAVLLSFLPCEQGGLAISNVIFGKANPSGRLPITYPKSSGRILPYFHRVNVRCPEWQDCEVQWPFGYGLSYSTVAYTSLRLNATQITPKDKLEVSIHLQNHGPRDGLHTVLVFLAQSHRIASVPEARLLKRFKKIELKSETQAQIQFTLTEKDWSYVTPHVGRRFARQTESGMYQVQVLVPENKVDLQVPNTNASGPSCQQDGKVEASNPRTLGCKKHINGQAWLVADFEIVGDT